MRVNRRPQPVAPPRTHEGAIATPTSPYNQLQRSVLSCMLWEDTFYENGVSIAQRIEKLVTQVNPDEVMRLARRARGEFNLRHAPLHLLNACIKAGKSDARYRDGLKEAINDVIQRADEMAELLAMYWKDGKQPLTKQLQRGLAMAFTKFTPYSLAKYNRDEAVKMRDVLFLSHAKPQSAEQAEAWRKLVNGTLEPPNTWEVKLTACHNETEKRACWIDLLEGNALGALALIRNLRNMQQVGVPDEMIREALNNMATERVLPFRFITAHRHAPKFARQLENAMLRNLGDAHIGGSTVILVDVSGSMDCMLSQRSEMTRWEAAAGLALLGAHTFHNCAIYSFSYNAVKVPNFGGGFDLIKAIGNSQSHGGTNLGTAIREVPSCDRLIVITDEQSHERVVWPKNQMNYCINVGSYQNGVSYNRDVIHLDGFSDAVLKWMVAFETT